LWRSPPLYVGISREGNMLETVYLFVTVAWFVYMMTEESLWDWNDTPGKKAFVSVVVSPLWPVLIASLLIHKLIKAIR
jgi:hypothetical protein